MLSNCGKLATMNRLYSAFERFRAARRPALLPYITGAYPDAGTTVEILRRIDSRSCACVEIGIPFSDSIADGPVIQTSFSRALERGFKLDSLLSELRAGRAEIDVALVAMVSYSIVYRRDPRRFVAAAAAAGFDGLLVPDLAFEEAGELAAIGRECDCPLVMMIAPTTGAQRRRRIVELSEPFIYYQLLAGVTGERGSLPADLAAQVGQLRRETDKPICVGFGIATPEHVRAVCTVADGAIVGSAIVRRMNAAVEQGSSGTQVADVVSEVIADLARGLE